MVFWVGVLGVFCLFLIWAQMADTISAFHDYSQCGFGYSCNFNYRDCLDL